MNPSLIGRNGQNQFNKQINSNPKCCGPKGSNRQCSQETPNHKKLKSSLVSVVKKNSSKNNRCECDQEITVAKTEKATKFLENSKSPGNEGLPAEFSKTYNEILKTDLHRLYFKISQLGEIPRSMCQTVISCLYQKGDREDITNRHPILLLNYDKKIYTKILAKKMQSILEDVIDAEQTAAIKGRIIIENLQLNRDVMLYANANKIQVAMIELDQEKAFGRVDCNFLFKTLQHFGYGPEIIQKIKTVYRNIERQVKINGHLSQNFLVKRGLRQGRLFSMTLSIIFAKTILENIRQENDIKGIVIGAKAMKLLLLSMMQQYTYNISLADLETQLKYFEKATDIKYNKIICTGIWLGSNKSNLRKPLDCKFKSNTIIILGYIYGHNTLQTREQNWER